MRVLLLLLGIWIQRCAVAQLHSILLNHPIVTDKSILKASLIHLPQLHKNMFTNCIAFKNTMICFKIKLICISSSNF